ncbi:FG-GAP repeat domain-containing protein [Streptomyces sp. NBC_00582]|uniref:FG-GAP repeat domain-containing protein n=1 Tax=Streptomyces sp. NBC_00582 TaxID=2975783 RepID=UPI002E80D16D|nr:VCBS repeat-containing protein [Streptomyces sp. NBC_00582]WUB61959.1 VCBS repeat-containing protein [Streptomyces sp. NBC_00582]
MFTTRSRHREENAESTGRRRSRRSARKAWALAGTVAVLAAGVFVLSPGDAGATAPARGDFDGDGTSDLVYRNVAGQLYVNTGAAETMALDTDVAKVKDVLTPGDLDSDGVQDVLTLSPTGVLFLHSGVYARTPGGLGSYRTVASGWQIYNKVVAPGDLNGDGKADLLARTPAGTLYFYPGKGTGAFGSRVTIGTGWQQYDELIGAGDLTGDGIGDLLARTPAGVLYRYTGKKGGTFNARVKDPKTDWASYGQIIGGGDWDGNGKTDLLARDFAGQLWFYPGNGNGTFGTRSARSKGWGKVTQFAGAGNNPHVGKYGTMARTSAGAVYSYQVTGTGTLTSKLLVGTSWPSSTTRLAYAVSLRQNGLADLVVQSISTGKLTNPASYALADPTLATGSTSYNRIVGPGDVTGDGKGDLLAVTTSGTLYLYPGDGTGTSVASRVKLSSGWQAYNALIGAGDVTGDGRPDLLARDTAGTLWRYAGTGSASAPFSSRVKVGTGWQTYKKLFSPGDANGDGKPDLMATTSTGALYFYAGTGTGGFKPRVSKASSGWDGWADLL